MSDKVWGSGDTILILSLRQPSLVGTIIGLRLRPRLAAGDAPAGEGLDVGDEALVAERPADPAVLRA